MFDTWLTQGLPSFYTGNTLFFVMFNNKKLCECYPQSPAAGGTSCDCGSVRKWKAVNTVNFMGEAIEKNKLRLFRIVEDYEEPGNAPWHVRNKFTPGLIAGLFESSLLPYCYLNASSDFEEEQRTH